MAYDSKLTVPVERVLAAVADRYGISAEIIDTRYGYLSTTMSLRADSGTFILKVCRIDEVDLHQLAFADSASQELKALGIPIPGRVLSRDGSASIRETGNLMMLSRFLDGESFEPGSVEQLRSAGAMLGRLHRAGARVPSQNTGSWPKMWNATVDGLRSSWQTMGSEAIEAGRISCLQSHLGALQSRVSALALSELPRSVIHGDYRAQNLLYRRNRVSGVLDLDSARPAERLFDLAYAAAFFQAVVAEGPLDSAERRAFLQAYDEQAALTEVERDLLPAFLKLSLLRGLTLWLQIAHAVRGQSVAVDWFGAYVGLLDERDMPAMG